MHRLRISEDARRDLKEIQEKGLEEFGFQAVRRHMAGFERIFTLLRERPAAGEARPEYGREIRSYSHWPHRLFYETREGEVLIVRILHGAMDARRTLDRLQ